MPVLLPPVTVPLNATLLVVEQMVWSEAALTIANLRMEILIVSIMVGQAPLLVEDNVKVTLPSAISAGVKKYRVFNAVSAGTKLPVPLAFHIPVFVPPVMFPVRLTILVLEHKAWLGPALVAATCFIVTCKVSVTDGQTPLFVELRLNVITPAATSDTVMK